MAEYTISGNTGPLEDTVAGELVDLRVLMDLNLPAALTMQFRDPSLKLWKSPPFSLGDTVSVSLKAPNSHTSASVFKGAVTAVTLDRGPNGLFFSVAALDAGHKLARKSSTAPYTNMSIGAILKRVASRNDLTTDGEELGPLESSQLPYLLHTGSDYELVNKLAHQTGHEWWVDGTTLHIKKVSASGLEATTLTWGDNLLRCKVRQSAVDNVTSVKVAAWDPATQKAINGTAEVATGTDGVHTSASAGSSARTAIGGKFSSERLLAHFPAKDQSQAQAVAKALAARMISGQVVLTGEAKGTPALKPGHSVKLKDVNSDVNANYVLTHVEHIVGAGRPYTTKFSSGASDPQSLVDLIQGGRGPAQARWGADGIVIGVVTNNKPSTTDGAGVVKVKFPTLGDNVGSTWARVAMPGASKGDKGGHGLHLMPELNDEVVVTFEHGDLNRPIVIGSLWSSKRTPPVAADTAVTGAAESSQVVKRTWQARTGHMIQMTEHNDSGTGGDVTIKIGGEKESKVVLNPDGVTITTAGKVSITSGEQQDMVLKSGGNFTVDAVGDVSIKSSMKGVKVQAFENVELTTSTGNFKASGVQANIQGMTQVQINGGPMVQVKGAMIQLG